MVAVDLFCGAGGLTHGLSQSGISVVAGIDLDPACQYPLEANNSARFLQADVAELRGEQLSALYPSHCIRLLVGCAPCQAFSRYARGRAVGDDQRWGLLRHFARLVGECRPDLVSMENVPELAKHRNFTVFVKQLRRLGYAVSFASVYGPDHGIPQNRTRLVLLASRLGELATPSASTTPSTYPTVRSAIADLPTLRAGEVDPVDPLHRACRLAPLNLRRIQASRPGGTWRDWPRRLIAKCHRTSTGETYPSVYGRMEWDLPAPTITTQFFGFGNGRFGHPEQDRAISLREGALLQSFPATYRFAPDEHALTFAAMGRLIGNAVPVRLGESVGRAILAHVHSN